MSQPITSELTVIAVDQRQLATILAALSYYHEQGNAHDPSILEPEIRDVATAFGTVTPLIPDELDALSNSLKSGANSNKLLTSLEEMTNEWVEPLARVAKNCGALLDRKVALDGAIARARAEIAKAKGQS